jgi:hypothetical protein
VSGLDQGLEDRDGKIRGAEEGETHQRGLAA